MKKYNKILSSAITIILSTALLATNTFAHSSLTGYQHELDVTGWDIYENSAHWVNSTTTITVNKEDFKNNSFGDCITNAVDSWNNETFDGTDLLRMKESGQGVVKFCSKTDKEIIATFGESAWAVTYRTNASLDANNHFKRTPNNVQIWVNWNDVLSNKLIGCSTHTALHKLGHVIGLKDISNKVSYNDYLMCNEFGQYHSVPKEITNNDKQGAAVILGQHSSHNLTNIKYDTTYHRQTRKVCGVYKNVKHSFSNGICSKCGYKK